MLYNEAKCIPLSNKVLIKHFVTLLVLIISEGKLHVTGSLSKKI